MSLLDAETGLEAFSSSLIIIPAPNPDDEVDGLKCGGNGLESGEDDLDRGDDDLERSDDDLEHCGDGGVFSLLILLISTLFSAS